jgi:myo-inositol-1(or 4)-monophosphatase
MLRRAPGRPTRDRGRLVSGQGRTRCPARPRHDLLALAVAAACTAGRMLAERHGRPTVVSTKTSPTDVVTEMDQAAERLIRREIWPGGHRTRSWARRAGRPGDAPVRWIVDRSTEP